MGFLKRIGNRLSGGDEHVARAWDHVQMAIMQSCPADDPAIGLVKLMVSWFAVVIYSDGGRGCIIEVPPKTITPDMVFRCLLIQTALYYRYAELFRPAAAKPLEVYTKRLFAGRADFLNDFKPWSPPSLYDAALASYGEVCGLRECDQRARAHFHAVCAGVLPGDVDTIHKAYCIETGEL